MPVFKLHVDALYPAWYRDHYTIEAETEEDLLPSYVGKFIIQCPQCMTLFYKNEEDIEKSLLAGMNAHIAKPFEPAVLFQTLSEFIG